MYDVREVLGIKLESPYFDEAYAKALAEEGLPFWLTEDYIRELNDKYAVLPETYEMVKEALPHVVAVPELCLLAKTVYHMLDKKLKFGKTFTAFETPGHTVGSTCFYVDNILFTGDTLFCRGIGRSDFHGGNGTELFRSLKRIMSMFPENTSVLSGHGPETTIADELNYFGF